MVKWLFGGDGRMGLFPWPYTLIDPYAPIAFMPIALYAYCPVPQLLYFSVFFIHPLPYRSIAPYIRCFTRPL